MIDKLLKKLDYDWIRRITEIVSSGNLWQYSTFITYYIFFTLFPLAVGIINAFQFHNLDVTILHSLLYRILPPVLSERLIIDIDVIYSNSSFGIYLIALISSIWTISWITSSIVMGINRAYGVGYRRNLIVLRLLAFSFTIGLAVWFGLVSVFMQTVSMTNWQIVACLLTVTFLTAWFVYTFIPNAKQKYYQTLPGAIIVTLAFLIAGTLYFLIMRVVPQNSILFTLLGAFMIIFAITQKLAFAILIGALANRILIEKQEGEVEPRGEESSF